MYIYPYKKLMYLQKELTNIYLSKRPTKETYLQTKETYLETQETYLLITDCQTLQFLVICV